MSLLTLRTTKTVSVRLFLWLVGLSAPTTIPGCFVHSKVPHVIFQRYPAGSQLPARADPSKDRRVTLKNCGKPPCSCGDTNHALRSLPTPPFAFLLSSRLAANLIAAWHFTDRTASGKMHGPLFQAVHLAEIASWFFTHSRTREGLDCLTQS